MRLIESPRLGQVVIKLRYRATSPAGIEDDRLSWLTLTFAREKGGWRLVFDQSTMIQTTP